MGEKGATIVTIIHPNPETKMFGAISGKVIILCFTSCLSAYFLSISNMYLRVFYSSIIVIKIMNDIN